MLYQKEHNQGKKIIKVYKENGQELPLWDTNSDSCDMQFDIFNSNLLESV